MLTVMVRLKELTDQGLAALREMQLLLNSYHYRQRLEDERYVEDFFGNWMLKLPYDIDFSLEGIYSREFNPAT